jgi:hypothetical protein
MNNNISKIQHGSELINRYIDALTNLITMERAKITAARTEIDFMQHMGNLGTTNGIYLTTEQIPVSQGELLLKESFNAHLTKVQSEQIAQKSQAEVSRLNELTKKEYIGKKITIDIINKNSKPFDGVYLNKNTGQFRISEYTAKRIKGTIYDVVFGNNLLVVKPNITSRVITPNRVFVHVYVLDLETMNPNVGISL